MHVNHMMGILISSSLMRTRKRPTSIINRRKSAPCNQSRSTTLPELIPNRNHKRIILDGAAIVAAKIFQEYVNIVFVPYISTQLEKVHRCTCDICCAEGD